MIEQMFQEWLQKNSAYLVVAVRTPQGEVIKPENFIPQGWTIVVGVNKNEKVDELSTVDSRDGNGSE